MLIRMQFVGHAETQRSQRMQLESVTLVPFWTYELTGMDIGHALSHCPQFTHAEESIGVTLKSANLLKMEEIARNGQNDLQ